MSRMYRKNHLSDDDWWSSDEDDGYYDEAESDDENEAANPSPQRQSVFSLADALQCSSAVSGASRGTEPPRPVAVLTTTVAKKLASEELAAAQKRPDVRVPVASVALSDKPVGEDGGALLLRQSGKYDLSALDDASILCVASYLPLRSIASLGCVNRRLDVALSSDFLYCLPRNAGDESKEDGKQGGEGPLSGGLGGGSLLPCLRDAPSHRLLPAAAPDDDPRPKGVARKFAIESTCYAPVDPSWQVTRRVFRFVDQLSTNDVAPNSMTFLDRRTLAYTTMTSPAIALRDVISSETRTVKLPDCANVCQAAFGSKKRLCATLSNRTGGGRLYLTVVDLSPAGTGAGKILWQIGYDEVSAPRATLAFDENEDRLLLRTHRFCRVYDARLGEEQWASNDGSVDSCLFHGSSSVVLFRGTAIEVYDVRERGQKCIARARVPGSHPVARAASLDGKLFAATCFGLFCLDIDADAVGSTAVAGSDDEPRSLRKIASSSHGTPSLAVGNGKLYVSVGCRITVLDPRSSSSEWASYKFHYGGVRDVQDMIVDDTKLILILRDCGHRPSLNIIPIDAFAQSSAAEGGRLPPVVLIAQPFINQPTNRPSSFDDSAQTIGKIALRGNFLATSFSWTVKTYVAEPTETGAVRSRLVRKDENAIRTINIQREDRSNPGSYWKVKADRESEQRRQQESMERVRQEIETAEANWNRAEAEETLAEEEERKQRIYRRKEAKKEAQRANRSKDKAATQRMSHARGNKKS